MQVEAAQRTRNEAKKAAGEEHKPRFFQKQEDGMWVLNDAGWKRLNQDWEKGSGADLDMVCL